MRSVHIERVIPAPIDKVFDFLTDATNYKAMPGVIRAELVTPGRPVPQGIGAVRVVVTPMLKLTESIVDHQPPHLMRYRIVDSIPPMRHENGYMRFTEVPGGTKVTWHSEFEISAPALADALTILFRPVVAAGFRMLLHTAARKLRAESGVKRGNME